MRLDLLLNAAARVSLPFAPQVHVLLGPLLVEPGCDTGVNAHDCRINFLSILLRVVLSDLLLALQPDQVASSIFDNGLPRRSHVIVGNLDSAVSIAIFILIIVGCIVAQTAFSVDRVIVVDPVNYLKSFEVLVVLQHLVDLVNLSVRKFLFHGQEHGHRVLHVDTRNVD